MALPEPASSSQPPRLRLWPGVVLVTLQWVLRFAVPVVAPEFMPMGVMAGLAGGVLILVWWLFLSRAPWSDRLGIVAAMAVVVYGTWHGVHESISGGMMGFMFFVYVTPCLCLALVVATAAGRNLQPSRRRVMTLAAILLACGAWLLVRTGGFSSDLDHEFAWRWAETPEDRLLAPAGSAPRASVAATPAAVQPFAGAAPAGGEWPGFRGPGRDGIVRGVRIETDWAASPPVELWRRPVGPAWSSFAISGGLFYTQEQRGEVEVVACYNLADGTPVWQHEDRVRFWESNAGAGPRGTPTLHDGRIYALGATGILNALEAASGAVVWTREAATDTKSKLPDWGFSGSPLVVGDTVIAAVGGTLAAYDRATGALRWLGPADGNSYSSPHLVEIDGIRQILLMSGVGATSVAPADGKVLWQHAWKGFAIVQPAQIANGELLVSTSDSAGARRLAVTRQRGAWSVEEKWTSKRLKPYFNDFVVHGGHAYGFDGGAIACVDLADGERKWKGGRYGRGQLVLLADQDVLLVLSEQGELALVAAVPGEFTEVARRPAVEGKTWNHPVVSGDLLLVRNDREMVAYRLKRKSG